MKNPGKVRVAIIGTGGIASTHADAVRHSSMLQLCGCYNRTAKRGKEFAMKYDIPYYSSVNELLEKASPEIVVNALAPHLHLLGLEEAAAKGCHLIVEKPLARSMKECRDIIALAERWHVRLAVSESGRFNAVNRSFTANREKFGRTLHILETNYRYYFNEARFTGKWGVDPVEGFGGMLLNVGVHRIAKMRMLAGSEESSVTALAGCRKPEIPVEGDASFLIRYKNGAAGLLQMCGYFPTPNVTNVSTVITEKGYVNLAGKQEFSGMDGRVQPLDPDPMYDGPDYVNFYRVLERSFSGEAPFPGNAEEAMRDVAVILAALKSQKTERKVDLNEIFEE